MPPDIRFRRFEQGDTNAVWLLHDRTFRNSDLTFYPDLNRYLRDIPTYFLDSGGEFLVGIVDAPPAEPTPYDRPDERIVAMGGFVPTVADPSGIVQNGPFTDHERAVAMKSVRVDPEYQRQGIGRSLMAELEERAVNEGAERAVLDTGGAMTAAQSMYESLGYDRVGQEFRSGFELIYYEKCL